MGKTTTPLAASGDTFLSPDDMVADNDIAARPSRRLELITAVSALILSSTALILSRHIDLRMDTGGLNPRWWPTVLASLASVLSAILIGMSMFGPIVGRGELESANSDGWVRMALALALSLLYVLAWSSVGYVVPTVVYLAALLWVFGLRSTKGLISFPLITTTFIYVLFHFLLRVPL